MDAKIPDDKILLGCYEIQSFLGRGGFGETYLAIDKLKMNSRCVIKRLKPKKTDEDTLKASRTLFKREAQFLYKLGNHDQIPRLLADFEEEEEFYLAQEFIAGDDFKKELESLKQLDEAQVIAFLKDVFQILKFVHQYHVIHRDIKPSNLIRRRSDGKFVLIDFGSVKQISAQETSSDGLTSSTIAVGTRGYMPNEQQGGKPRPSSDIYALGMTAIHALTGKLPTELEEDRRTGEVIWRKHAINASKGLADILDKMVKSHYIDRYQEADDVLKDLQKLQNSWESQVVSSFSSTFTTRKLPKLRLPRVKYVLIILAVIGAAFTIPKILPSITQSLSFGSSNTTASNSSNELLKKAEELFQTEKYQEAITLYDKALNNNPDNAHEIWRSKAIALYRLEKYPEALSSLDKALAIKPDDVQVLNDKAYVLINQGKFDEAINIANKVLAIDARSVYALNNRGRALAKQNKNEDALKDFAKSIDIAPNNYDAWRYKANTLHYNFKKYQEAVDAYNKATTIQPTYFITWSEKGQALLSLQSYQEALYSFDEAIKIQPQSVDALIGKSIALYKLNRYE